MNDSLIPTPEPRTCAICGEPEGHCYAICPNADPYAGDQAREDDDHAFGARYDRYTEAAALAEAERRQEVAMDAACNCTSCLGLSAGPCFAECL